MAEPTPARGLREGLRDGAPFAVVSFVLSTSFGVVATEAGFSSLAAVVMSAVVFAGSAQFTAIGILAAGGGVGSAVAASALMNSRFVPMGFALGPSLRGGRLRRAVEGQATVDSSWAMSARGDGTFDREYLFGHTGAQYVAWVSGTAAGVLVPDLDARALGLDALFPAFFLSLLWSEVRDRLRLGVALGGAAVALALVPFVPAGVPVLVAGTAALVGLREAGVTGATTWTVVGLVAVVTFLCKGVGPFAIGDRALPAPLVRVVVLLASALLAALVATSALADGGALQVGARTAGVATAAVLLHRRAHIVLVVVSAAVVTAVLRQLGVD